MMIQFIISAIKMGSKRILHEMCDTLFNDTLKQLLWVTCTASGKELILTHLNTGRDLGNYAISGLTLQNKDK